jgi:hypothetical protein
MEQVWAAGDPPRAIRGELDLRQWDFAKEGPITLQGEWAFHWEQLLRPQNENAIVPPADTFRQIPGLWNRPDPDGKSFPAHGFATWHLRIQVPADIQSFALDFSQFFTSAEVYANHKQVFQAGQVGTDAESSSHSSKTGIVFFDVQNGILDLVIPMANFVHPKAGFGRIRFAPASVMVAERERRTGIYYWILGTIAIMGVYHLGLYILRREERSTLYFAVSCAINGAFTLVTSGIIFNIFPNFSGELWWEIFYITWFLGYPAFVLFAWSLFPQEFGNWFVMLSKILGYGGTAWVLMTSFEWSDKVAPIFQIYGLFFFAYTAYAVIKAHRRGRPHALIFLTGTSVYFTMIMHDVLAAEGLIDAPLRSSYGLVTFFLFQSFLLAARFSKAFSDLGVKEKEITELNNGLERMVDEKTRDIRSILHSIQQGIFMMRKTRSGVETHPDFSNYLRQMLRTDDIGGEDPLALIFRRTALTEDQKSMTRSIVEASLGEPALAFELNQGNLPSEIAIQVESDRREVWEVDWTPVLDADSHVDRILVSLRDVTRLRQLQEEAVEQQKELEYISEIVNVSASNFDIFIRMSRALLDENKRLIQANSRLSTEVVKILFINMHTIKGNARGYHFRKMSGVLHAVEHHYAELLSPDNQTWDQTRLLSELHEVEGIIQHYDHINRVKLGRQSQEKHVIMERQVVAEQIESLNLLDLTNLSPKDRVIIEDTRQTFVNVFYSRSLDVLENILGESERLARDLKKDKPIIMIDDPGFSLTLEAQELFRNIFTHIIRNSLDHGIESPQERIHKGKRPSGKLELVLRERDGQLVLRYQDDGRGLNLRLLRDVGIRRGFLPKDQAITRESIAELIFVGGLSTSAELTEISGRGVGMDAVKRYILQIGGDIRIWLDEKGEDAQGYCAFSLEIMIPGRLFSQSGESRKKAS